MTNEQIEKAAQQHADELRVSSSIPGALVPMLHGIAKSSYICGAHDALQNQWISVKDRLPEEDEEILCRMKSNGAVVSGFIFINKKGIPQVATDSCFHFEDYEGYEPTHWMPLSQLNPEKDNARRNNP